MHYPHLRAYNYYPFFYFVLSRHAWSINVQPPSTTTKSPSSSHQIVSISNNLNQTPHPNRWNCISLSFAPNAQAHTHTHKWYINPELSRVSAKNYQTRATNHAFSKSNDREPYLKRGVENDVWLHFIGEISTFNSNSSSSCHWTREGRQIKHSTTIYLAARIFGRTV